MDTKYLVRAALPLAVGSALLAGCGGSSSGGGGGGSNSGGKTFTIACQGPLTGDNAALGVNICDGAKLAIDQANASGDLSFKLAYKAVDDQGDPTKAPAAAQSEVGDSNIIAIVGPAFSGATQASEQYFTEANLASVTASATLPTLTDPSNHFTTFFRTVATDSSQGAGAADYIAKVLKASKVYSVNDGSAYGQGLAKELESNLAKQNISVVKDSVPAGTKQYATEAGKIASSGADVIYYSGYYADAGPFAKALKAAGFKGKFMSDDGTKDPNFVKLAGGAAAEGALFTCPCSDPQSSQAATQFVSDYKKAFNQDAGTYSAEAFDAANTIIAAMKSISGTIDRAGVVSALKTIDYQGITKQEKFQPNGELSSTTVYLYQVKNGTITYLGPIDQLIGG